MRTVRCISLVLFYVLFIQDTHASNDLNTPSSGTANSAVDFDDTLQTNLRKRDFRDDEFASYQRKRLRNETEAATKGSPSSNFPLAMLASAASAELKRNPFSRNTFTGAVESKTAESDAESDDSSIDMTGNSDLFEDEISGENFSDFQKAAFTAAIQSNDYHRILAVGHSIGGQAHFKIYSPVHPQFFTYPLHFAIHHKLKNAFKALTDYTTVNYEAVDSFGNTALALALKLDQFDTFSELLKLTENLKIRDSDGKLLTHIAASSSTWSTLFLESLKSVGLDFCAVCTKKNWTPLCYAVNSGNLVLAKWINDNTPCDASHPSNSSVALLALERRNENMALELLKWGAPIVTESKQTNRNILHCIARHKNQAILRHVKEFTDVSTLKLLLNKFDAKKKYYPIHYAAKSDNLPFFIELSDLIDISLKAESGPNALEISFNSKSHNVFRYLMDTIKLDEFEDNFGSESPLAIEVYESRDFEMIYVLLDFFDGENIYFFDDNGLNLLHHAILAKDLDFIKLLVESYDADPTITTNSTADPQANSPFSWAVYKRETEIIKVFLEHMASFPNEMVRISYFFPDAVDLTLQKCEEKVGDEEKEDEDEDVMSMQNLIEIFGDKEIQKLIEQKFFK